MEEQQNMKYKDWLEQWLNNYIKPTVKQRTFEHYEDIVHRQIVPRLGDYDLETLLPSVLQEGVHRRTLRAICRQYGKRHYFRA